MFLNSPINTKQSSQQSTTIVIKKSVSIHLILKGLVTRLI